MDYREFTVNVNTSLIDAMKIMDKAGKKIIFVEGNNRLAGVATDGDIRRWILKKGDINSPVYHVMNTDPLYILKGNESSATKIMKKKSIDCLPVVDEEKQIVSAMFKDFVTKTLSPQISAPVVIMAGGKGTRLYPYTKILPKPLLPIGDLTIIERIANNFVDCGCSKFYLTLNYKKNMIKAYFNDLAYDVDYIEEEQPMGTGGSLFYLKDKIKEAFFVSNCDILVKADYFDIFHFHKKNHNLITVVASLKHTVIPYGVIDLNQDGSMKRTMEKPQYNHLINTGMYVLEPSVLEDIQKPEFIHITDMIEKYLSLGEKIGVFPIGEDAWLDMGQIKEMENMIKEIEYKG